MQNKYFLSKKIKTATRRQTVTTPGHKAVTQGHEATQKRPNNPSMGHKTTTKTLKMTIKRLQTTPITGKRCKTIANRH